MPQKTWKGFRRKSFKPAKFIETTKECNNPQRGWYQIYTIKLGEEFSTMDLEYTLNYSDRLALVLLDISAYSDRDLDEVAIKGLRSVCEFFRDYRLDMIVRAVYDLSGNCQATEPSSEEQILSHIGQIFEVLRDFKERVFVYQGLLIGNWGEMHSSKFLSPSRLRTLSDKVLKDNSETAYLAVRRPAYIRIMFPEGEDLRQKQVGIFDDAILASPTHLGTFGEKPANEVRREQSWLPEEEIAYVSKLCDRVPYGGEALWNEDTDSLTPTRNSLKLMAEYFSKLHVTYLNRIHDPRFIDKLKSYTYDGRGIYKGMNGYDYFSRHLGYRFTLTSVKCENVKGAEDSLRFEITIKNSGFARAFFDAKCVMEALDLAGNPVEIDLSEWVLLKNVSSGEEHSFIAMTPMIRGYVFLRFTKTDTDEDIIFTNKTCDKNPVGAKLFIGTIN